jgi:hypothetical protein
MRNTAIKLTLLSLLPVLVCVHFAFAYTQSMAVKHPTEVEPGQMCSECHTDWRAGMDHTADFSLRHKFYAYQQRHSCSLCHAESFCTDCHAHKEELKPSEKYKDSVTRALPHRGDYINQHKIDGRLNPASCFKCHGRQNNERCRVCHLP